MTRNTSHFRWSAIILSLALLVGIGPGLFNFIVDPYRMHAWFDLGLEKKKIATKKHGPLFKVIEYPRTQAQYIVLGDSRSRALRDKLFHELGFESYYNFAYSGGTITEAIDTFWYAVEHVELKGVAIGVPLRSMDEKFSGGKNQVPEAIRMREKPMGYYANLFVANTGLDVLEKHHPETMSSVRTTLDAMLRVLPFYSSPSQAQDPSVDPTYCNNICESMSGSLWRTEPFGDDQRIVRGRDIDALLNGIVIQKKEPSLDDFVTNAGSDAVLPPPPELRQELAALPPLTRDDKKWQKRIEKGGRNDWKSFAYSEDYYQDLKEIADYARANDIDLMFFIPPAHADMQSQLSVWGRDDINLEHRRRMAELGPVLDYDVPTELTMNRSLYTDPYHFKASIARGMASDLIAHFGADADVMKLVEKRRKNTTKVAAVRCPIGGDDPQSVKLPGATPAYMGQGCILWGAP